MISYISFKMVDEKDRIPPGLKEGFDDWVLAKDLPEKKLAETEFRRPEKELTYTQYHEVSGQKVEKQVTAQLADQGYPVLRIGSKIFRFGQSPDGCEKESEVVNGKERYRVLPKRAAIINVQE